MAGNQTAGRRVVQGEDDEGRTMSGTRDREFTDFVRRAADPLGRTAWLLTGDPHAAADLVQAALVKTYLAWRRVRPDEALAFARRVLVNESIDRWRRRHGGTSVGEDFDRPSSDDEAAVVDDRDAVVRLLRTLPPRQRAVIVLRYYHDLSEQAVADQLNISVGAVKSAASRGLAVLRAAAVPLTQGEPT